MTQSTAVSPTDPGNADLDEAWAALRDAWGEVGAHKRFVQLASVLDRLPDAARRYRELKADPDLGAEAERGLELVLGAAMAKLSSSAPQDRAPPGLYVIPMLVLLMVLGLTLAASHALGRTGLKTPAVLLCEVALVALVPWRRVLGGR